MRQTIGPSGGLVSSHDDVLTLVFQPGALTREHEIVVFPSDEPPAIIGPAYRVKPDIELLVDVEVGYRRALPDNTSGVTVAAIQLGDFTSEMGHWAPLPRLSIHEDTGLVRAYDTELSLYYGLNQYNVGSTTNTTVNDTDPSDDTATGNDTDDTATSAPTGDSDTDPSDSDTDPGPPGCSNGTPDPGELCFSSMDFDMTGGPVDVTLGDFNSDGNLDVATANGDGSFSVRLGDGTGEFGTEANVAAGNGPTAIAAGDLDGAMGDDLVISLSGSNQILLLQSLNSGSFTPIPVAVSGAAPSEVLLADADGNGGPDILVAHAGSGNVSFFSFAGGGLGPEALYTAGPVAAPVGLSFGQYNQGSDTNADVFVFGGDQLAVLPGNGTNFGNAPLNEMVGTDLRRGIGGEFGGAGGEDAAIADASQGGVHVLLGDGTPLGFLANDFYETGDGALDVAAADVNSDSDIDLIVANGDADTVTVLLSTGGTSWGDATDFVVGSGPTGVVTGDINGDGIADVVVSYAGGNGITVLRSDP